MCAEFDARKVAAVARARAAIEVAAVRDRFSAAGLLTEAFDSTCQIDSSCIAKICQRMVDFPDEAMDALNCLSSALTSDSKQLCATVKAVTIINDISRDERILAQLASRSDMLASLRALQEVRRDGSSSPSEEDTIRTMATEIGRRVETVRDLSCERKTSFFDVVRRLKPSRQLLQPLSPASWGSSAASTETSPASLLTSSSPSSAASRYRETTKAEWEGDGEGHLRGRSGAEAIAIRLRRAHSAGAITHWMKTTAPILGDLLNTFRCIVGALQRTSEELDCLDDGSTSVPICDELRCIPELLATASEVASKAVAWQDVLLALRNPNRGDFAGISQEMELACFLEEALAVADELHCRRAHLIDVRREAIECAKARIEAAAARAHFAVQSAC